MFTFQDIFKKSFLEGWANQTINTESVIVTLIVTLGISLYIFFAYRVVSRKTFYSKTFNISLVCVALITAGIIITIQSNIVVSLGMVGALSIVRFRTAIKNPMDLMFMYWGISTGIVCGAGFAIFAICLAIVITIALFVLDVIPIANHPMILIINAVSIDNENEIVDCLKLNSSHYSIKARSVSKSTVNYTVEIRTSDSASLIKSLTQISGVDSASLLTHNGEITY